MTREEALSKVQGYLTDLLPLEESNQIEEITKALEPKTGYWIVEKSRDSVGRNGHCSNCKDYHTYDWCLMRYCPNCGAKMERIVVQD